MTKLAFLIISLTVMFAFCERQTVTERESAGSNAVNSTEKDLRLPVSAEIDWKNGSRFYCASSAGNKIWATTLQGYKLLYLEESNSGWRLSRIEETTKCVNFIDENNGWKIDSVSRLWATNNGGKSWTRKSPEMTFPNVASLKFIDSLHGWIHAENLYFTNDGGDSWKAILSYKDKYLGKALLSDFFFLDTQLGWACDGGDYARGFVFSTSNGGYTWSKKQIAKNAHSGCTLFFINPNEGWYFTTSKYFFSTLDGGKNWVRMPALPLDFITNSMYWFNANDGWLAGFLNKNEASPSEGKGTVLRTEDGGKTWIEVKIDEKSPFFDKIYFTDSQRGWLISRDSIYTTSDGGKTWKTSFNLPLPIN